MKSLTKVVSVRQVFFNLFSLFLQYPILLDCNLLQVQTIESDTLLEWLNLFGSPVQEIFKYETS